jgi:hypothetical protein
MQRIDRVLRAVHRVACAGCLIFVATVASARGDDAEIKRLVEQIARGSEQDAGDAAELLIQRLVDPVAAAIGSMESRPAREQLRIRAVLSRLAGALRMRLFRADLRDEDRALYDAFAAQYEDLTQQLFDLDFRVRLAAVRQVPLEPNTGAGVVLAAKVNDEDENVAMAALDAAAKLHDEVVARGLTRYVHDALEAIRSGFFGAAEEEVAATVVILIDHAIRALGEAKYKPGLPAMIDATHYLARSRYAMFFDVAEVARAMATMGDESAAAVLIDQLENGQMVRTFGIPRVRRDPEPAGEGENTEAPEEARGQQTVGDVVLLSLLTIYKLAPEAFGVRFATNDSSIYGFENQERRDAAVRQFRIWHQQNSARPAAERVPPTSQAAPPPTPASSPSGGR